MSVQSKVEVTCDETVSLFGTCREGLTFLTGSSDTAIRSARRRGWAVSKKPGQPYSVRCPAHRKGGSR